jgi:hypothetical protein
MIYLIAGLFAVCVVLQFITVFELSWLKYEVELSRTRQIADRPLDPRDTPEIADEPTDYSIDASELTETELLIIEREAEFDLRIAKMKEELALSVPEKKENPTEAISLHPLVQNLPHHIIMDSYDSLPDVEYTR